MSKDTGGPAFPHEDGCFGLRTEFGSHGMSMRDYFAAKAMQGMLADLPKSLWGFDWIANTSKSAYEIADAMLQERSK